MDILEPAVELICRCATVLPPDVSDAMKAALKNEQEGTAAYNALETLVQNIDTSSECIVPMCQDTGAPMYWVNYPRGMYQIDLEKQLTEALRIATERTYLRPNAVDPLTGENSGDNTGEGVPAFHFHQWEEDHLEVSLMLKGGGCENTSTQYKLPDISLDAGRDLEGVRRCVVDAVYKAQGRGCSPGIMGVCIGGNRDTGYVRAKEVLFRKLTDPNPNPELDALEKRLYDECNQLGIGPMGFGGNTTVIGIKIGTLHRLPASFYVSIAYMCWAMRRYTMTIRDGEVTYD